MKSSRSPLAASSAAFAVLILLWVVLRSLVGCEQCEWGCTHLGFFVLTCFVTFVIPPSSPASLLVCVCSGGGGSEAWWWECHGRKQDADMATNCSILDLGGCGGLLDLEPPCSKDLPMHLLGGGNQIKVGS